MFHEGHGHTLIKVTNSVVEHNEFQCLLSVVDIHQNILEDH